MDPSTGFGMFDPWELINTMDMMKMEDPALANQIGQGLDKMGYTRDVVTQALATGAPLPPPRGMDQFGGAEMGGYGGQAEGSPHMAYPPTAAAPPTARPAPGGMGEQVAPDMTSAAPSFVPPASLGGLSMPTSAPQMPGAITTGSVGGGQQFGPPAPGGGVDARTQALRAMAANQGIKAPQETKPQVQDIRQAPPPPKVGDVKVGATAIQALLAAALHGGGGPQNPLRVPPLGALVGMGRR